MATGDYCPRCRGIHDILKDCPHTVPSFEIVEARLKSVEKDNGNLRLEVKLLREALDKSNLALAEAVKTKEERDRLLLQVDELKKSDAAWKALALSNDALLKDAERLLESAQKEAYAVAAEYLRAEAAKIPLGEGNTPKGFSSSYNALVFGAETLEGFALKRSVSMPKCVGCGIETEPRCPACQ